MDQAEPQSGRFEGGAHYLPVRIYYEDTDFSGLVYHANYLRYCERGRSNFLRAAGVSHTELLGAENPTAFAVNRIELDFLKPARIDDAITVETRFARVQGPRVFVAQRILRGEEVLVKASLEVCCISLTGRPKKPPGPLLERLKPFLEPAASSF